MKKLLILSLFAGAAMAQTTQPVWVSNPGYSIYNGTSQKGIGIIDSPIRGNGLLLSPFRGYLKAGVAGAAKVDMNRVGGTAVGVYGIAEGVGIPGGLQDEVTGIYGRADKNGPFWATGLHGECLTDVSGTDTGGSCIGVNVELIGKNPKTLMVGLNVQPRPEVRNMIGIQIQDNPITSYKYAYSAPNMVIHMGTVDDDHFCMKFVPNGQRLEFWRKCNRPDATRTGYINMNYGAADTPMNR